MHKTCGRYTAIVSVSSICYYCIESYNNNNTDIYIDTVKKI